MEAAGIRDVVVVIPGIMGSELVAADGRPLWSTSYGGVVEALRTLGRNLDTLTLEAGVGDADPADGVTATRLLPGLAVVPGLWRPIAGYTPLWRFLTGPRFNLQAPDPGRPDLVPNLVPFPYDWRVSNRLNGKRLTKVATTALERWRALPGLEDAELVLVAHSMGGLVARWFLEQEGGAALTRALVTLGTPHRGAANALDSLSNGAQKGVWKAKRDLTPLVRSFPSVYQLLPTYACIDGPQGRRTIAEAGAPNLDTTMAGDAAAFHETIKTVGDYELHKVLGIRQQTATTATVDGVRARILRTIDGHAQGGDGTVPRLAAELEDRRGVNTVEVVEQHGEIQHARATADLLDGILTRKDVIWQAPTPTEPFGVDLEDDVVLQGQVVRASVTEAGDRRFGATLLDEDGSQLTVKPLGRDDTVQFADLAPGGYRLRVAPTQPGVVTAVTAPFVVVDEAV